MKSKLYILTALVVVLVCTSIAIAVSKERQVTQPVDSPQVTSLKADLKKSEDLRKQHDAVNTTAIKNAGDQITELNRQKGVLCVQIKTARLPQPLCQ